MGKTERDVCLFHEDDSDHSAYPCPSPVLDRDGDDLEDLMVLPCQEWFDTEAPEAFERDNLSEVATTVEQSGTTVRSEVRIESPREISPTHSSVGTRKVEGEFTVRNVTKLAGQLPDKRSGRTTK